MNYEITKRIFNLMKSRRTNSHKHQTEQPSQMSQSITKRQNNKIELKYVKNEVNESRVKKLKLLDEHIYKPTPYMSNCFLQSLFNIAFSDNLCINYKRELVKLQDGGQISLDWALPINLKTAQEYNPSDDTKILFVVHGLTGGSNMNYIKEMIQQGQASGYRCVAFNSRGINTQLTTPVPFNGECLDDLSYALNLIKKRYPKAPLFAVGASFGSNMLLRLVGNMKERNFLDGIVGLSTPFNVIQCIEKLGRVYEEFFVYRYKANCIDPHLKILKSLEKTHNIDFKKIAKVRSLREYHEQLSIKLFNYSSVDEYFEKSMVKSEQLLNIKCPSLLLHSKDDPIVTYECIPQDILRKNPFIIQADTENGAHNCWFTGIKPERWYPKPVIQFFEVLLEENQQETSFGMEEKCD
ncbi:alpha/beta hydrolase family protein (macronuclear) [Tetrahymena thermophila SB210]|uniref:Alpha/beta hydrolase family protein n=1 Tax=Tetrahymena thermophila (strain SB210) TaxID=312017 RepID=I7MLF7_TETTS|nr:alpha/beta hydrolase family protein [Tetrahymena thermophila SB210]EAS02012.2 alpha/beta hydrolase family protein [Tetrahymena thermophila SB210]|eukprot:XP_001022257.2 alpha/beta hydrolase family protein [Tetrahymena thermophila SB210]